MGEMTHDSVHQYVKVPMAFVEAQIEKLREYIAEDQAQAQAADFAEMRGYYHGREIASMGELATLERWRRNHSVTR